MLGRIQGGRAWDETQVGNKQKQTEGKRKKKGEPHPADSKHHVCMHFSRPRDWLKGSVQGMNGRLERIGHCC